MKVVKSISWWEVILLKDQPPSKPRSKNMVVRRVLVLAYSLKTVRIKVAVEIYTMINLLPFGLSPSIRKEKYTLMVNVLVVLIPYLLAKVRVCLWSSTWMHSQSVGSYLKRSSGQHIN
jgi:uncharacterized membrane protein YwaF